MSIKFAKNIYFQPPASAVLAGSSMSIFPIQIDDSISLNTFNFCLVNGVGAANITYRFGLYSLNSSTLSLANSWSITIALPNGANGDIEFKSGTSFSSANYNITPGTWFVGWLESKGAINGANVIGGFGQAPANKIPGAGAFAGGAMTVTSAAVPASVATSALSQTSSNSMFSPLIMISA